MHSPHSMKKELLKKWMMGLQVCISSKKKEMTLLERKKAIKLSADVAMASTRNGKTSWSRALIINASKQHDNKILIERVLGRPEYERLLKRVVPSIQPLRKIIRSKKILKRSCSSLRRVKRDVKSCKRVINNGAYCVAKSLMNKRRKILRSLVPGGEMIVDDACLIEETLDYMISLRAQVDVMRSVAEARDQLK